MVWVEVATIFVPGGRYVAVLYEVSLLERSLLTYFWCFDPEAGFPLPCVVSSCSLFLGVVRVSFRPPGWLATCARNRGVRVYGSPAVVVLE